MRDASSTPQWEYWIPIWSNILQTRDLFQGNLGDGYVKMFTGQSSPSVEGQLGDVLSSSRDEYLADREHTEMREDTAYQRAVADMRAAGLNPFTVGASGASSSASQVGANMVGTKLEYLGYILDLKNLNLKNKKLANDAISNILGFIKK